MKTVAVIVAGGSGTRASSGGGLPKQYCSMAGRAVLTHTLEAYARTPGIDGILTVIRPGDEALYEAAARGVGKLLPAVHGGGTRQQSVLNGLRALADKEPSLVLIHDAARPFTSRAVIERVIASLGEHKAAIAALPVADTLKRGGDVSGGAAKAFLGEAQSGDVMIAGTVDRTGLWAAQTPQAFHFADILAAHEAAATEGHTHFSDDAAIAEWRGMSVALVMGSAENWKITTAEDLARAERQLAGNNGAIMETRTATGFDVHAFEAGDHVILCGVAIPHTHRLKGHSDADAALHALTDALLGTIGAGDIGDHFPPSDPQWRGAESGQFLAHARDLVAARGGRIVNVDVTIMCERPKIGPHKAAMQARVAEILGVTPDRVGVKATTTEELGFTGRREGLAALATATVQLPAPDGAS